MRDKVLFGVLAVSLSLGLFALVWWGRSFSPLLASYVGGLLIPAAAIMIAALGFGWRRKAGFLVGLIVGLVLIEWAFSATGFAAFPTRTIDPAQEPVTFLISMVYGSIVYVFPLAMLVIFVGRRPSRLWTRARTPAQRLDPPS